MTNRSETEMSGRVDTYTGTREDLRGLFPGERFKLDAHEHSAWCGGYYLHTHQDGRAVHEHEHKPCDRCTQSTQAD